MATSWTLTAQDVISDALQIMGLLGAGQTAAPEDYGICMTALQNIIKELPLHGLSWPKITVAPVALAWSIAAPAQVAMPADYFGVPVITQTVNGANVSMEVITKATYAAIQQPGFVGPYPKQIYIAPNNVGFLWPVPDANPALSITYQAISLDADDLITPDVAQSWLAGMGLWVAYECAPKFGVPMVDRQDIERRFMMRRARMLAYAAESAPIRFTVAD